MEMLKEIEELARRSQDAPIPALDVRQRVRATLRALTPDTPAILDTPTLAFAGLGLAIMVMMLTRSLPALHALRDPWSAYMTTPWNF